MANRVLVVGWDGADWDILDPLLAAGELPALQALVGAGTARRLALVPAVPLLGGLADLPHGPGSGRPRRLRHPRVPARGHAAAAGLVPLDPGADLARAPLRGRARRRSSSTCPLTYPPPEIRRRRDRRRRRAARADVQPSRRTSGRGSAGRSTEARGRRSATGRSTSSTIVEALIRKRAEAMRTLLDEEPWDAAVHRLRLARPHPALPARVRPSRAPRLRRGRRPRRSPTACATSTACSTRSSASLARAHRRGRPRHPHVRPRPPAVHAGALDEQGARAAGLPPLRARLRRSSTCSRGGASARSPASPTTGSACMAASPCRPHRSTGRTRPPTRASSRRARACPSTSPAGSRTGRVAREDYERVRDEVAAGAARVRGPGDRGRTRSAACSARRRCSTGPYLDRAPDLLLRAGAALQPHARAPARGGGRLALRRPPAGGHLRPGRPGRRARSKARRSRSPTSRAGSPRRVGLEPDPEWGRAPAGGGRRRLQRGGGAPGRGAASRPRLPRVAGRGRA